MGLFHAIAAQSIATSSQWDAQALANTAWACSAIAMKHVPLLQSIAAASLRRITEEKSQERSNTAWAFATMELKDWPLMEAIKLRSMVKKWQTLIEANCDVKTT